MLYSQHFTFHWELLRSCKQDRKEQYWVQQFWQMERDISVRLTEMTRPVTVDHGPNRNGPSHLMNQPNFPEFWVEWKAPYIKCDSPGTPPPHPIVTKCITLYILKHYNKKYIWRLKSEKIAHMLILGLKGLNFCR